MKISVKLYKLNAHDAGDSKLNAHDADDSKLLGSLLGSDFTVESKKKLHIYIGPNTLVCVLWLAKNFVLIFVPQVKLSLTVIFGTQIMEYILMVSY